MNDHPGNDPAARLRFVLDLYPNRADDDVAVEGTYNQHGNGERVDLTFGHLRALANQVGV